jgi:hypothetical protein
MLNSYHGRVFDGDRLVLSDVEFFIETEADPWSGMFEYPHGSIDVGRWILDIAGHGKAEVMVVKCIVDPDGIPVAYFKGLSEFPRK